MVSVTLRNKLVCALALILSGSAQAAGKYTCQEILVKSLMVPEEEQSTFCFYDNNPSYFISENCVNLSCLFLQSMKTTNFPGTSLSRPGQDMCKRLGGFVERVKIKDQEYLRCVSPKEHSAISLNLLESWNGSVFMGPGK